MNEEETLALWAQGKDAWNAWAQRMLDQRAEMAKAGTWQIDRNILGQEEPGNEETWDWIASAAADFTRHVFELRAQFQGFLFPSQTDFTNAKFQEIAQFDSVTFRGDARFSGATFRGDARFGSATFGGYARFNSATFKGAARFGNATFSREAEFNNATFSRDAWFSGATFARVARFGRATFRGNARFGSATFGGYAWFDSATFSGDAKFVQCSFEASASFVRAVFEEQAHFAAVHGERAFSLEGARFKGVPDFIQATFAEAPRLDNVRVRRGKGDADLSARYRALKRLAIDGHDHAREQEYFAGELKALRGHPDRLLPNLLNWFRRDDDGRRLSAWPGGARYWVGLVYQLLSAFGRSMRRPLGWWLLALAGFAFGYLDRHFDRAAELGRGYADGVGDWLWATIAQPLVAWFPPLADLLPLPGAVVSPACLVGPGEPWSAALGLSIRKALPFAGVGSTEKLNQIYACLYGIHGDTAMPGELPARFTPVIPDAVDYMGIVQLLLSLLLLFLFLLAVRNHFRIR